MIKALLDTNIFISYLLNPQVTGTIAQVVDAGIAGLYVLLLPGELFQEMFEAITRKEALSQRVKPEDMERLASLLLHSGETIAPINEEIPDVSHDIKDNYLLAYAVIGEADYLVTGDMDLLVLERAGQVQVVSPADFLAVLKKHHMF